MQQYGVYVVDVLRTARIGYCRTIIVTILSDFNAKGQRGAIASIAIV